MTKSDRAPRREGIVTCARLLFVMPSITIKQIDRVVIYHVHNHLCSRIISVDGTIWYNDNITTGNNSIQDGHLSTMNYEELKTCNEKDLYLLYMYNLLLRKK